MHFFLNIFGIPVPSYGFCIVTGGILANIIAYFRVKKLGLDINDFIVLEGYTLLGAIIGAKLLYLIVSYKYIDWSRITDNEYMSTLLGGGFVFYGGFILGITNVLVAGKIHKMDSVRFIRELIFLVPFVHGFGRIGCFMAGCCYGVPYDGFGAVVFPKEMGIMPGVSLFPVQLVESALLLLLSALIFFLRTKFDWKFTLETYMIMYAIIRFALENYRYDEERGIYFGLSTSQWISSVLLAIGIVLVIKRREYLPFLAKQK